MKKNIVLFVIFMLLAPFLFAQNNQQDVVYLKNGSVIRGFISEFIPDSSVTIKTEGQSIFVFEMSAVEKITREDLPAIKKARTPFIKEKGYFNETDLHVLLGSGSGNITTGQSVTTVNGYQINRFFRVGGGLGVSHYNNYSHTFFPLFARVSGDVVSFRVTPIYFADAGYAFLVEKDFYTADIEELSSKGGLYIKAGVGLKFYTASKASISLTMGFSLQKSEREYQYLWSEGTVYNEDRTYQRILVGLGIAF